MSTLVVNAQSNTSRAGLSQPSDSLKIVKKGLKSSVSDQPLDSATLASLQDQDSSTQKIDSIQMPQDDSEIKEKILYEAQDSIVYDLSSKMMYLYNKAKMTYGPTELQADSVDFDWNTFTLYANGVKDDSTGEVRGKPIFKDKDKEYSAGSMAYNFKSKKGKVYEVYTQEGEAYLQSKSVKRNENEEWYGFKNKYTTCNLEHPHFHFSARKVKMIPNKVIVTGPANLVIADVPTPLYLPFGIFPVKQGRRSGIIFPQFGEDARNGFFLRNGGYYFAINDNLSLKLLADIYTNGTFGIRPSLSFNKMYKFNGNLNFAWIRTQPQDPDLPNAKAVNDFNLSLNFNLDPRAAPTHSFSAAVNFLTSNFIRADRETGALALATSFNSNINYEKRFTRFPFLSLSLSLNHSQNLATKQFNLTFPVFRLNVSRVTPFRSKVNTGTPKWYENIGITYNFEAKNVLNTFDSLLFKPNSWKNMRNGMQHNLSIDAPFVLAKYLNVSPSFRYTERWYFQSINRTWQIEDLTVRDPAGNVNVYPGMYQHIQNDTTFGFYGVRDFEASVSFNTKLTGIFNFKGKYLKGIRHIFTPSITAIYRPDFGTDFWGYYRSVQQQFNQPENQLIYSPYDVGNQLYGVPGQGMVGALNFSLANNFEAKIFSKKDTVKNERKIAPLERLNISGGYNFAAITNKLNPFLINGNFNFWENFGGNFNLVFDPYAVDSVGVRTNTFQYDKNKQILRFQQGNITLSGRFAGKAKQNTNSSQTGFVKGDYVSYDPYLFYDFNIPWAVNVNYTFNVSSSVNPITRRDTLLYTQSITADIDFNLTPKWKIAVSSGFDITRREATLTNFTVMRDLHCWELNFNWTAFPLQYQQFLIELRVKASMLRDLKLTRRRSFLDNNF